MAGKERKLQPVAPSSPKASILTVTVNLGDRVQTEDLESQLRIDTDLEGLNRGLAENPGRFAWWGMMEVKSRALQAELKSRMELLEADLFVKYQTASLEPGAAKLTVDGIKGQIKMDEKYKVLAESYAKVNQDVDALNVGRRAMEHRRDSLLAIASNMRAEMDAHMRGMPAKPEFRPGSGGPSR